MTEREALKLSLEAMKSDLALFHIPPTARMLEAITAIKEALAQPEQEPVKYDCCGNCMRPQHEHNGTSCPKPYTTVWHAWDYDFSPYPAPAVNPSQQAIHCKHRRENSGVCPHHNLQCGWPKCNEPEQEPVAIQYASKAERDLYEMEDEDDTIPPQRTPLTNEQVAIIYKAWQEVGADIRGLSWGNFVKEIALHEAAHGIKEKNQ